MKSEVGTIYIAKFLLICFKSTRVKSSNKVHYMGEVEKNLKRFLKKHTDLYKFLRVDFWSPFQGEGDFNLSLFSFRQAYKAKAPIHSYSGKT